MKDQCFKGLLGVGICRDAVLNECMSLRSSTNFSCCQKHWGNCLRHGFVLQQALDADCFLMIVLTNFEAMIGQNQISVQLICDMLSLSVDVNRL